MLSEYGKQTCMKICLRQSTFAKQYFCFAKTLQGLVKVSTGLTRSGGPWLWADRSEAETVKRSFTYPRQKIKSGLVMVSMGPTRSGGPWLWVDRSEAETVKRSFTYPRIKIESGLVMVSTGYVKLEKRVVWRCVKWPN